ncbi:TfoX/Sxy family DNA transformation protein [Pasteurellaceae bacterium 22721_9_1]
MNITNLYEKLTSLLGEVKAQRLFSGIGIFHNNHMFAICKKGCFYLRAKGKLANDVEKIGAIRWDRDGIPSNLKIKDYYQIPSEYIIDEDKNHILLEMMHASLRQIEDEKLQEALEKAELIRRLPNLSLKYERLLAKVGITTISQLREVGAADAYVLIKSKGIFVTSHMFWKTFAALKNKYVELLTEVEKDEGFAEVNKKLALASLRSLRYRP